MVLFSIDESGRRLELLPTINMNVMMSVVCDTCEVQTNLRVGMSNRDIQPFRFCCPSCGSPIDFTIGDKAEECKELTGAREIPAHGPFDDETNFVDLHLDFPVKFGKYVMGRTPFMMALQQIGAERFGIHNQRLNELNLVCKMKAEIRNLIRLYSGKDKQLFRLKVEKFLKTKLKSSKPQDINAGLYLLVSFAFKPFVNVQSVEEVVEGYPGFLFYLADKDKAKLEGFIDHLADTGFLRNVQLDALDVYPDVLDAELALRPALMLDFDDEYQGGGLSPARVSTDKFNQYKDLYKDIAEVINRQLVIVAGINNLLHRGDYDAFADLGPKRKAPKSLQEYANVSFGAKPDWLDNCWFIFDTEAVDNQLRNAIAHFKAEYDDSTQLITYYPKLEGMEQEKAQTMYFLDFMRKLLCAFREMNYLHHLVKSIYYYRILIQKKGD
ncbi:hypothetical protein DF027_21190 [Burkholderia cenocepacia]|nr:hypothetical protein DF027_21190 [Burkholderia cenocepacia]RQV41174.1 hypothetical protein DF028_14085 [Burkholderia cenocepacia]RQV78030.1 hypothetical protein DF010_14490 [Burkholderia cenocepacia]